MVLSREVDEASLLRYDNGAFTEGKASIIDGLVAETRSHSHLNQESIINFAGEPLCYERVSGTSYRRRQMLTPAQVREMVTSLGMTIALPDDSVGQNGEGRDEP